MKPTLLLGALALSTACAMTTATAAPADDAPPPPAAVQKELPNLLRATHVPGVAIARITDGRLAWTGAWGVRAPDTPMDTGTVFNVASLTKPTFALMTLHLVADGRWSLDDPLARDWVDPDVADDPRHQALTTRIALSHQTGLPNWRGDKPMAFSFAPGARHEYSGEGYEYLRRAIEHRTGKALPALMQANVLAPAGMHDSWYGWNDAIAPRLATGFDEDGTPRDMAYLRERGPNAAANLFTTIGDYGRFTAWVARGAGLPKPLQAEMQRPQALHPAPAENFGLGWRVSRLADGATVLSHDGREPGVRTQVFVLPGSGEGLVILANGNHGELLTRPLVQHLLPRGDAVLAAMDAEVWTFLQRMPRGQAAAMVPMLSRSPSFMSKLLHAAQAGLMADADVAPAVRAQADAAIDRYVRGMLEERIAPEAAADIVKLLIDPDAEGGAHWRQRFSPAQARAWAAALSGATG